MNRLLRIPRAARIFALCGLVLALLIALDIFPWLRGDFGWRWPYQPAPFARIVPLFLGLTVYTGGAVLILRRSRHPALTLLWGMAGVVALSLLVVNLRAADALAELFARTASTLTTGVHYAGTQIAPDSGAWRDWISTIQQNPTFGAHVVNGPPGLPLFYSLLSAGLDGAPGIATPLFRALLAIQCHNYDLLSYTPGQWASAWFGVLMPVWAALGVLPMYAAARCLPGTRYYAREIALWYPLIPALGMFAGTWYTVYPAWMLAAFWLLASGVDKHQPLRLVLAGAVMGLSIFMAYAVVPVIGFFGMYTLAHYWFKERAAGAPWQRPVISGVWFGVGLALPWLAYGLWSGETPFDLIAASLNLHLELERPYLPWVFLHFWDWMLLNGFVFMLAWLAGVWLWRRGGEAPLAGLSLLIAMVALCLSGTARGETGRVWLAFTPFALLAAGEAVKSLSSTASRLWRGEKATDGKMDGSETQAFEGERATTSGGFASSAAGNWLALAVGQGAVLLALAASLDVIHTDFSSPPVPPPVTAGLQTVDVTFSASDEGGAFRLTGWDAQTTNDQITLRLAWEGAAQSIRPYYFGAVLVAADGGVHDAGVWQPGQGAPVPADSPDAPRGIYPTTCWLPGQAVGDTIRLALPPDAAAGDWWISLSAYGDPDAAEGRLPVLLADGTADTQVGLGPVAGSSD